jgi:hypothetical protein
VVIPIQHAAALIAAVFKETVERRKSNEPLVSDYAEVERIAIHNYIVVLLRLRAGTGHIRRADLWDCAGSEWIHGAWNRNQGCPDCDRIHQVHYKRT